MGLFEGIEDAKVGAGGVYFLPGTYLVEVKACLAKRSRKGNDLFIVECKILESDNTERAPGMEASWVVNITAHDAALGNIKGFIAAVSGIDPYDPCINQDGHPDQVTSQTVELACSEANPFGGRVLPLVCANIKTREGKDFTKHDWHPCADRF